MVPTYKPMVQPPKGYGSRTRPPATQLGGNTPTVTAFPVGGEMVLAQGGAFGAGAGMNAGGPSTTMEYRPGMPTAGSSTMEWRPGMPTGPVAPLASPGDYATGNSPPQMPYQPQQFPAQPAPMPQAAPGKAESPYRQPSAAPGTSVTGGYVYDPDTAVNMDPRTQAWVDRTMQSNQTAGSGPYDNAYNRFGGLKTPPGPNQRPLTPPPVGTVMEGGTTITDVSGRTVGLGPSRRGAYAYENAAPGTDAYRSNEQGQNGRNGVYVNTSGNDSGHRYTPAELEANRQRSIENSQNKRDAYRTGRRDRAIKKYGLDHLTPSYAQAPLDAQRYSGVESGDSGTSLNPANAGTDNRNVVQKKHDLDASIAHPIFADSEKSGFKPDAAGIPDMQRYYGQNSKKWNAKDKAAFKDYVHQRKTNDPDGFGKQWDEWASQTEYVMPPEDTMATPEVRMQHFEEVNAFRAEMGLPPLSLSKRPNKTVQANAF